MATKKYIAEQILRKLYGGNIPANNGVKEQELYPAISQYANSFAATSIKNEKNGGMIDTGYLTSYDNNGAGIAVLQDTGRKMPYIVIPAPYLTMDGNIGLYHISPMQDQSDKYIATSPSFMANYSALPSYNLGYNVYWAETVGTERRAYLPFSQASTVLVKLVLDNYSVGERDEFYMPTNIVAQVIETIFKSYEKEGKEIKDKLIDQL